MSPDVSTAPTRPRLDKLRTTILIVDDETDVLEMLESNLIGAGFKVLKAEDGTSAIELARREALAVIVLDLMLPEISGFDVCKVLKAEPATSAIPIVILSAKAEEIDRILGLELGADDYLTKPFSPRELVLRVKSVMRRATSSSAPNTQILRAGDLVVDRNAHLVRLGGKSIDLTAIEFKLLMTLFERRGRVQSRETLLTDVWGYATSIDTRTVDAHVRRLREKLGRASQYVETIRGFGYRIREGE